MTLFSKAAGRYFYVLNRSSRRTTKSHKSRGGAHGRLMYDYNTSDDNAIYIYIYIQIN